MVADSTRVSLGSRDSGSISVGGWGDNVRARTGMQPRRESAGQLPRSRQPSDWTGRVRKESLFSSLEWKDAR